MNNNLLDNLNEQQLEAVKHGLGPMLIVAGAGTGKTTVITKRVAYLILAKEIKIDEVLALTFTDKAAQEMEERIDCLLPYGYVDLWIHTFHKFCEQILRQHALEIGLSSDFKVMDSVSQWLFFRKNLDKFKLNYYRPLGNPGKFINALIQHFSRCKDEEIYSQDYLSYAEQLLMESDSVEEAFKEGGEHSQDNADLQESLRIKELADCYHTYQQLLVDNNSLDFGDLIAYTLKLFRDRPKILRQYQKQFKYILVDEFQDTNWAQYELIKLLASAHNNLTVVADDDQSIYRFRGASMSNILRFQDDFANCKQIFLINNYRTQQNILDLAYDFIQHNNPNRLEYQLKAKKGNKALNKKLISQQGGNGIIEHIHCASIEEELASITNKMLELYKKEDNLLWSDFAILIRANNQAEDIIAQLETKGIPYTYVSSRGLYAKPLILDLIAYLRFINNHYDNIAAFRMLDMPYLEIPYSDLMAIVHFSQKKGITIFESLQRQQEINLKEDTRDKIKNIGIKVGKHAQMGREQTITQVAYNIVVDIGMLKWLNEQNEEIAHTNIQYLNQFFKTLQGFEKSSFDFLQKSGRKLRDFLEYFDLALQAGDEGSLPTDYDLGPETVKILTVHASKGLEFKYVFVVNLVDKRFPSIGKKDPIAIPEQLIKEEVDSKLAHLEEERRLFYVAVTRAKHGLFLTSAVDYGGARKKKLSQFLLEAGFEQPPDLEKTLKKPEFIVPETLPVVESSLRSLPLPAKFSFTQLKSFAICPYQYKLAHLIKLQGFGKHVFSYGQSMHTTLQRFYEAIINKSKQSQASLFARQDDLAEIEVPSLEQLLEMYEDCWLDDWYENELIQNKYKKQGRESLIGYYNQYQGSFIVPLALEKGINLKIGSYTLVGRVDRVDKLSDNSIEIIDYKTGKKPETIGKMDKWNKRQLLIYQLAFQHIYKEPVSKVTFYYLDCNESLSFIGKPKDLEKLQDDVVQVIEEIKISKFEPKPGKHTCMFCDFKDICEYRDL